MKTLDLVKTGVSISVLLWAGNAVAQEPAPAPARPQATAQDTTEVIVTATRRKESRQTVPMSIDAVSGTTLQKLNLFDVKDISQLSPGLSLTNTGGRNNTATLRGIAFDPDTGTSPAVDLYFNEVPTDAQTMFTAMYDLQQVEVLRGPQGTLRGRTAPAGAITLSTRRPDLNNVTGYIQATATDSDGRNLQGAVSVPIIPGMLAIRASGLIDRNNLNQVYNVTRKQRSHSETGSSRISVAFAPNNDFNAVLTYQDLSADNIQFLQVTGPGAQPSLFDPTRSGPAATPNDYVAVSDGLREYRNRTHFLTFNADWDLGSHTLSFVGGHQDSVLNANGDNDVGNAVPGYENTQRTRTPVLVDTAELRLASKNNPFWNYSASVFANRQSGTTTLTQKSDSFFANAIPATPYPASFGLYLPISVDYAIGGVSKTIGIAGSSSFQFNDKLRAEVGVRYGMLDRTISTIQTVSSPGMPAFFIPAFVAGPTETIAPADAHRKRNVLTGGANLTYKFARDVMGYAAYGRSFRDGTVAVGAPPVASLLLSQPETSDSLELGLKTRVFDRRMTFNTDVFYQKFKGYISRAPGISYDADRVTGAQDGIVDSNMDVTFNANAISQGIEASLAGRITDAWDFSANVAYIEARYDNAMVPCNDYSGNGQPSSSGTPSVYTPAGQPRRPISLCASNGRIGEVPKFNLTMTSEYTFDWGNMHPFVRGLYTYTPGFYSSQALYDYDTRNLLNIYAGIRGKDDRWELKLSVKNALDEHKVTYAASGIAQASTTSVAGGAGAPFNAGFRTINTENPREVGLTLTFNY